MKIDCGCWPSRITLGAVQIMLCASAVEADVVKCSAGDVQCVISAIVEANTAPHRPTTVRLAGGVYPVTAIDNHTDGPNGFPSIVGRVTIDGGHTGAALTRVAGAPDFRLFHVASTGRLDLIGLHLEGGRAWAFSGGALLNKGGIVTVVNSVVAGNGASLGGGMFNDQGSLTITDSAVVDNDASGTGGGLWNTGGALTLTRTAVERNGALGVGGLWTENGATRISDSRFSQNFGHEVGGLFALPIAKQIAEALEAAHEQGIIHRDLKPANIKLRPDGTVMLLSFEL